MSGVLGLYVCPRGIFGISGRLRGAGVRVDRTFRFPAELATPADAGRKLREALEGIGASRARISVAIRGFGAAQHVVALPSAPDHVLAPIVEREMRRLEPELAEAAFAWTPLPAEAQVVEDASTQRQLSVAAAPRPLIDEIVRAIRDTGNVDEHVTVLAAALDEIDRQFLGADQVAALAAPLPDGLFIGFSINGALRLVVDPPPGVGEPDDPNAVAEEIELGAIFLRQQFRGAEMARIALLASPDRLPGAESALSARLSVPVERLAVAELDAAGYAALGAILSAHTPRLLALAGQSRDRKRHAGGRVLRDAAAAAVVVAIAVGAWAGMQAFAARDAGAALVDARRRIEQESFGLTGARETAAQRKVIRDARDAIRQVTQDRLELQRTLSRIASAATAPIQLDSLRLDRATNGWTATVSGSAFGATNARAVQALSDFYGGLPQRLAVADLTLESLAYADSTSNGSGSQVRFTLTFDVTTSEPTP